MPTTENHPEQITGERAVPRGTNDADRGPVASPPGGRTRTVGWVLTVVLAVLATSLVMRRDEGVLSRSALAQVGVPGSGSLVGGRGVYAFSGQLTSKTYGVFMMDVDAGTIWCYELDRGANNELQLRLVSARSWLSDRHLEEYNVAPPIPSTGRTMVSQQRLQDAEDQGTSQKERPVRLPDTPVSK